PTKPNSTIPSARYREASTRAGLRKLVVAFAETFQAHRKPDAFFRGLEDDEGRGFPIAQFLDQFVVHHDFRDAAVGQTAHESCAADVGLVDLEAQPRWQQHAERRYDPHQAALLVGGLE